ncbi:hypothetical protein N7501_003032 [Penicillium viridicatum]|nr:hypothetical protein N7501_003032 [Penicillium viridicatum]
MERKLSALSYYRGKGDQLVILLGPGVDRFDEPLPQPDSLCLWSGERSSAQGVSPGAKLVQTPAGPAPAPAVIFVPPAPVAAPPAPPAPPVGPAGDPGPAVSNRPTLTLDKLAQVLDPNHANMDTNGLPFLYSLNNSGVDDQFARMLPARTSHPNILAALAAAIAAAPAASAAAPTTPAKARKDKGTGYIYEFDLRLIKQVLTHKGHITDSDKGSEYKEEGDSDLSEGVFAALE